MKKETRGKRRGKKEKRDIEKLNFAVRFSRCDHVTALFVFVLISLIYVYTSAPGVTLVDSGELILNAVNFAPGHPPGFPFYILTAGIFARLPFAEPDRLVNLFSALCGALAVTVFYYVVLSCCRGLYLRPTSSDSQPECAKERTALQKFVDAFISATAAFLFAFTKIFWLQTSVAEVYALNTLVFTIAFFLLIRGQSQFKTWELTLNEYAAFFLLGLGLGVHNVTFLQAYIAAAFFVFIPQAQRKIFSKQTAYIAAAAIVPIILVYSFALASAASDPIFNWGKTDNLLRLYRHFRGKQYSSYLFQYSPGYFKAESIRMLQHIILEWTPIGLALLVFGIKKLRRVNRHLFKMLTLLGLINLVYAFSYEIAEDKEAYYLTFFWCGSIFAGIGMRSVLDTLVQRYGQKTLKCFFLFLTLPAATLLLHWPACNHRDDDRAVKLIRDLTSVMPSQALLLTQDWQIYSPWLYLTHAEGYRMDLKFIDINLLRRTWYFDYLDKAYPGMMKAAEQERNAFMRQLILFENDKMYNPVLIQKYFLQLINKFIEITMQQHSVFMTPPFEDGVGEKYVAVPWGLAFRLFPPDQASAEITEVRIDEDNKWVYYDHDVAGKKVRWLYAVALLQRSLLFKETGEIQKYRDLQEKINSLAPKRRGNYIPYPSHL